MIVLKFRENWNAGTWYRPNLGMKYGGAYYISVIGNRNIVPGTNNNVWRCLDSVPEEVSPGEDEETHTYTPALVWADDAGMSIPTINSLDAHYSKHGPCVTFCIRINFTTAGMNAFLSSVALPFPMASYYDEMPDSNSGYGLTIGCQVRNNITDASQSMGDLDIYSDSVDSLTRVGYFAGAGKTVSQVFQGTYFTDEEDPI